MSELKFNALKFELPVGAVLSQAQCGYVVQLRHLGNGVFIQELKPAKLGESKIVSVLEGLTLENDGFGYKTDIGTNEIRGELCRDPIKEPNVDSVYRRFALIGYFDPKDPGKSLTEREMLAKIDPDQP